MKLDHAFDDMELDEINAGLKLREEKLAQRIKQLDTDAMPEAAERLRQSLALYAPNFRGAGLRRYFLRQSDIDDEVAAERRKRGEVENPDGQVTMFGGGAATGGGHPAGQTEKIDLSARLGGGTAGELASDPEQTPQPWDALSDADVAEFKDAGPYQPVEVEGQKIGFTGGPTDILVTFPLENGGRDAERYVAWLNQQHQRGGESTDPTEVVADYVIVDADTPVATADAFVPMFGREAESEMAAALAESADGADGADAGEGDALDAWDEGPDAHRAPTDEPVTPIAAPGETAAAAVATPRLGRSRKPNG